VSPRLGFVAQAIGVVALGSAVYLAFLSPEDPDPLTGIEVEDGVRLNPPEFTMGGRREGGPGQPKRVPGEPRRVPGKPQRARAQRLTTIPRLVPTLSPSSEAVVTQPVVTEPVDTPSGIQYADGVARILGRVASAQP
jgi:hypothetical protein